MNRSSMQFINLYQDALKPARTVGLASFPLVLLPLTLGCLVAATLWLIWDGQRLSTRITEAGETKAALVAEVEELRVRVGDRSVDPLLAQEQGNLLTQLRGGARLIELVETGGVADPGEYSFSDILVALARQKPDNLWLERIRLSSAGQELRLNGVMLSSTALTSYLERLAAEPTFRGRSFNQMHLIPDERQGDRLVFDIDSRVSIVALERDATADNGMAVDEEAGLPETGMSSFSSESMAQEP